MNSRIIFEQWAKTKAQDWFAYNEDELDLMFERDGDGYTDSGVQSAWMGFKAGYKEKIHEH